MKDMSMLDANALKQPWTILHDETVFEAKPFLRVSKQHVLTSSGQNVSDYYQIALSDFALICPLTPEGKVLTLWQYKHGPRHYGLTFPAGQINSGEAPEAAAARELMEETGYQAGKLKSLGRYTVSGNQGCGHGHLFMAYECKPVAEANSGDLECMDLRIMSATEVDQAIAEGALSILSHLAIWGAARLHGALPTQTT